MEAFETTQRVVDGKLIINLPEEFNNCEVKVRFFRKVNLEMKSIGPGFRHIKELN